MQDRIADIFENQRATFILWMPVGLGAGIAAYFAMAFEPKPLHLACAAALAGIAGVFSSRQIRFPSAIFWAAVMLICLGFLNAAYSVHRNAAPVLEHRYYGPVQGRIRHVDRSQGGLVRVTLDRVVLARMEPLKTPRRVRISLGYRRTYFTPEPGRMVITTASLSPPSGPVEPGGFDFQRFAWFRTLGAIGYTRMPVLEIAPPDRRGAVMWLAALRMRLARSIRARIPGEGGAFAAAILTGDRSAIDPATTQVLRDSNLAHLLAISGLHMGLLTGFVFAAIRYALAGVPYVALRVPVSRIAALGAFFTALGYLLLSGGNIATQRAFVMVAVMLLAVMIDRRALTLRAVALAAVIILVLRPESLIEAGFQMSFAATTALVAAFALMRDRGWFLPGRGIWRGLGQRMLALFLASLIAGIATAPISAFHFNRVAQFGLIANLASVPVMGLVIMPAAVLAVLVSPFGLAHLLWWVMGRGIAWVLFVATRVAALEDAVFHVPTAPGYVLALITGGALLCALLRGGVRVGGLAPVLAGLLLWSTAQRPLILISENGRLVGVKTDSGRWLSRAKGNGFVATSWLRSDGDASPQDVAAARIPSGRRGRLIELDMAGSTVLINLERKIGKQDIAAVCDDYALVIAPRLAAGAGQGARNENGMCNLITGADLAAGGSIAVTGRPDGKFSVLSAQDVSGRRLWTR